MEIKLPPTITARYEDGDWDDDFADTAPGVVVLEFGGVTFAEIPVTRVQHHSLTVTGYYDAEAHRERALSEVVACWLGERLVSVRR